jgi:hypothetical protein
VIAAPLITPEQLALEAKATELLAHPRVRAVAAKARGLMLAGYGVDVPEEAHSSLDAAIEEYVFSYVERVLCRDRNNFCLHYTCHPAYRRPDGAQVPACRFYGENPDAVYRWGGLAPDRTYRLTCRQTGPAPVDASFTLMGTYGGTTPGHSLDLQDLERDAEGGFTITLDSSPADGRANHLTLMPTTRLLLIREFLGDWSQDTPFAMTLEAEGAALGGPWDEARALDETCHYAIEEFYLWFWMNHIYRNLPPNSVTAAQPAAAMGGSAAMATAQGYFELAEDEAAMLEWDLAGARLSGLSALNWWYIPIDSHRISSTLNNHQAVPNADGTITVVLSRSDPGVANWLDCGGLRHVLMTARWQGLPKEQVRQDARIASRVVKLAELEEHLPEGMARCSPEERAAANASRLAAYTRRTGDMRNILF